jgi:hypothetical protein
MTSWLVLKSAHKWLVLKRPVTAHMFNRDPGTRCYMWQLKIFLAGEPDTVVWQKLYREQPFSLETQVYTPTFKEFAELPPGHYQAEVSLLTLNDGQPGKGARKTVDVSVP